MFTEQNTVENYLRDLLCGAQPPPRAGVAEEAAPYIPLGLARKGAGWHSVPALSLPRRIHDVFVEPWLREALIRLNPEIAAQPERANEVLYKLRAIVLSVRSDGLIRANEEFTAWLRGDRSMPFGERGEHVTVRLLDFGPASGFRRRWQTSDAQPADAEQSDQNQYVVTTQLTFRAGAAERRADVVLYVNGLPLVIVEAKTPVRPAISWVDGAKQIHNDYERFVPELFACNVLNVATEGKDLRYGAIHTPLEHWSPWLLEEDTFTAKIAKDAKDDQKENLSALRGLRGKKEGLALLQHTIPSLLRPNVLLDILAHFTLFATDKKKRRLKIICRYQQYEGRQRARPTRAGGRAEKGLDLALSRLRQKPADGLCRPKTAPAARPPQPHRPDRRGPD